MITLLSSVRRFLGLGQSERGQVLVLAAAAMVAVLGLAALAIDGGFFAHARRDAQNDADAMALAGVRELPTTADATTEALNWGGLNNVASGEVQSIAFDTNCDGGSETNTITVKLRRTQETFLARVFGISDGAVGVCATAKIGLALAGSELLPFGFHWEDPYYPNPNPDDTCFFYEGGGPPAVENPGLWYVAPDDMPDPAECLIKIPSPSETWGSGNSGPVRFDEGGTSTNYDGDCRPPGSSSGASEYKENINEGSECTYGIGDEITPKTGNMNGPTCTALDDRIGANADSIDDVFDPDGNGLFDIVNTMSPRYGLMPLVSASGSGSSADIELHGFITVYIKDWCHIGTCDGSGSIPACLLLIPVKSTIFQSGVDFAGGSALDDSTNAIHTIKLID